MKSAGKTSILTASVLALAAGTAMAQDKTLTINSFGGAYEEAHKKCIITPFEQETGAKVQIVTAYSADAFAQLRAQKDAPRPGDRRRGRRPARADRCGQALQCR
jgi:putative spermidine/putrescine transport system substrate-binding protein